MRRTLRFAFFLVVVLVALLVVNAFVLDSQTKSAGTTVEDGQLIELSNVELQYVDLEATDPDPAGEGEPIVLLHCYTCSLQWWEPLVSLLNANHRVISFDLIGHGGSEKPSSGYEIETQSAAVGEALNELGVRQATVVGHSMGGLVATSLAEQSSDLVDRVVLIGVPSESGDGNLPFTARASTFPVLGEGLWRVKLDSMVKSASAESFVPGADASEVFDDPDRVVEDVNAMTFKSFKSSREEADAFLEAGSVASRLTSTGVPVLAMDGAEDQILDAEEVLGKFAAIPGARIVTVPGAGHAPNVEQPDEVAEAILAFADAGGIVAEPGTPPPTDGKPSGGKPAGGKPTSGKPGAQGTGDRPPGGKKQAGKPPGGGKP